MNIRGRSSRNKKGQDEAEKKEGSSQRETSGVFGAQTHRPTAVHYNVGCGVGSKEKNR